MSVLEVSKSYKPFKYPWAVELALKSERSHWTHEETDFSPDVADWQNNLTPQEKNLVHQILKLFTESDKQVASMYTNNLLPTFKNNEIQQMLLSFAAREGVHERAYAALITTLNLPETDFEAFLEYKQMYEKIDFMGDNDTSTHKGRALSLVKNVFSEGVSLFGFFIMLLNFIRRGRMKGMSEVNLWSIVDEQDHCDGLIQLFKTYVEEHPRIVNDDFKQGVYLMATKFYSLDEKVIELAYEMGDIEGLPKADVLQYMKYLIDRRLIQMGFKGVFSVKNNPVPWFDELIGSPEHTNFFESKPTSYVKGGLSGSWLEAY
jgi:glutaredoxin 3